MLPPPLPTVRTTSSKTITQRRTQYKFATHRYSTLLNSLISLDTQSPCTKSISKPSINQSVNRSTIHPSPYTCSTYLLIPLPPPTSQLTYLPTYPPTYLLTCLSVCAHPSSIIPSFLSPFPFSPILAQINVASFLLSKPHEIQGS